MLSRRVPARITGSWGTTISCSRIVSRGSVARSRLSMRRAPESISRRRRMVDMSELLPL